MDSFSHSKSSLKSPSSLYSPNKNNVLKKAAKNPMEKTPFRTTVSVYNTLLDILKNKVYIYRFITLFQHHLVLFGERDLHLLTRLFFCTGERDLHLLFGFLIC